MGDDDNRDFVDDVRLVEFHLHPSGNMDAGPAIVRITIDRPIRRAGRA